MRLAVASGKGGTGKTIVSTNLALAATERGLSVAYVDCDVEAPNGHLFLRPQITSMEKVERTYPKVDEAKCTLCGECGSICAFSAIVRVGRKVLVFPELCHSCGGCAQVCKAKAITEVQTVIGTVQTGRSGAMRFAQGTLSIGEASGVRLIQRLRKKPGNEQLTILDCPPGTSCGAMESVRGADRVLLVTDPTPFGLHDLKLTVEMLKQVRIPAAVVLNRTTNSSADTRSYCQSEQIPIWGEISDERSVAEAYARGELAYETVPAFRGAIDDLLETVISQEGKTRPAGKGERRP